MKTYWSDFHTNIHSKDLKDLMQWEMFAREMLDFWAPVYYPYFINEKNGFKFEDTLSQTQMNQDMETINQYIQHKESDFIVYPAYEWQGNGSDGDHNIFFEEKSGDIFMPLSYLQLKEAFKNQRVIGIPHHTGYKSGHRGKNWETHDAVFSPIMEIYSSHGSSEASNASIPLNVHIHMGPRGEEGTFRHALKNGIKTGVIASGDNHTNPAISGNGFFAVYAQEYTRECIFENIKKRHTYGVSRSKIDVDFRINGHLMGEEIQSEATNLLEVNVVGTSEIDRIEIYRNGYKEKTFTWEEVQPKSLEGQIQFKFELECGWGPDTRVFPEIFEREWTYSIKTKGEIIDVEKCFTSPGSTVNQQSKSEITGGFHTVKRSDGNNKLGQKNYLTPYIQNQSLIIEVKDHIENNVEITINDKHYSVPIKTLLQQAVLEAELDTAQVLLSQRFGFDDYYREDAWWHNAYKILMHKAYSEKSYKRNIQYPINKIYRSEDNFYVKIIQTNGDTAWTSPIWIKK